MARKLRPRKKLSKAKYEDSWREDIMDYTAKENISGNTLAAGYIGE